MGKIDNSYMERLKEVLYDEKKPINYKGLSMMLGVHVNISKQMLYHFYTTEKKKGKSVFATYYISGVAPRKVSVTGGSDGEKSAWEDGSYSDTEGAFIVTICKEKDVEDLKAKLSKIFSIHIYSLSAFAIENYDELETLIEQQSLLDTEGRSPIDFGPIICSASQKLLSAYKPPPPAIIQVVKTDKNIGVKEKSESKKEPNDSSGISKCDVGSKSQRPEQKKVLKDPTTADKSDRLKSMFAKAAAKPKPKVEEKKETTKFTINEPSSNAASKPKEVSSSKHKDKGPNLNNDKDNSRKRKRIRDVLSSDSEGEEKESGDDEETLPESPIPRKRLQIDSDSEEDNFKSTSSKSSLQVPEKQTVPGRRRVSKMVSKSHIDKDGFLVTTKEQVMVSEDEVDSHPDSIEEKKNGDDVSKPSSSSQATKRKEEVPIKNSKSKPPPSASKTKQSSLMSFFQKK